MGMNEMNEKTLSGYMYLARALALRWICSDEGLTLETSAFESLYGG